MQIVKRHKLLILFIFIFVGITAVILKEHYDYNRDKNLVYRVATQLGYTEEATLGIYHHDTFNYDTIDAVFLTPNTLEEFSQTLNQNGMQIESTYGPSNDHNMWNQIFSITNISPPRAGKEPVVTSWNLLVNNKHLNVRYVQTNTDQWIYGTKSLTGNLVIIMLDRRR